MSAHPILEREALARQTVRVLSRGGWANPDVLLVRVGDDEGRAVVKDFAPRRPWVRATLGRWFCAREIAAYHQLAGHAAVPRFLGRIDDLAFALEYRPGRPLARGMAHEVPSGFLLALEAAIGRMHRDGVVHLDLKHRGNVLLGERGEPILVDFGSAVRFTPGGFWYRVYRPSLQRYDLDALRKWRERLSPAARPTRRGPWRRLRRWLRRTWSAGSHSDR